MCKIVAGFAKRGQGADTASSAQGLHPGGQILRQGVPGDNLLYTVPVLYTLKEFRNESTVLFDIFYEPVLHFYFFKTITLYTEVCGCR